MVDHRYPGVAESTYKPTEPSDPIRCWHEPPSELGEGQWDGPGWYFFDETWSNVHGPFGTLEECKEALSNYAKQI